MTNSQLLVLIHFSTEPNNEPDSVTNDEPDRRDKIFLFVLQLHFIFVIAFAKSNNMPAIDNLILRHECSVILPCC